MPPHETQYLEDSVGSVGFDVVDEELTGAGAPHVGQNLCCGCMCVPQAEQTFAPGSVTVVVRNSGGAPSLYRSPSDRKINTVRKGEIIAEISHPT